MMSYHQQEYGEDMQQQGSFVAILISLGYDNVFVSICCTAVFILDLSLPHHLPVAKHVVLILTVRLRLEYLKFIIF